MDVIKQQKAAKQFVERWKNRGSEKSDTHSFWLELLENVCGIKLPGQYIEFEKRVKFNGSTKFIDAYIPQTLTLIEQKDITIDVLKPEKQSDDSFLTPYQQGKRYADNLKLSEKPRWIIVCNFSEFYIYDQENPLSEPVHLTIEELPNKVRLLDILVSKQNQHLAKEQELSVKAGNIVGDLYNELYKRYESANLSEEKISNNLNKLIVRLVFLLYAEDSGILGKYGLFYSYLSQYDSSLFRKALISLFKVLDTPVEKRDPFLDDDLKVFPYVNGSLFKDEDILIPPFDDDLRDKLLTKISDDFDWSDISPTIFGATFESTLNPETRRSGGMHYTSIENIHKVIDPLFLNELKAELEEIKQLKQQNTIEKRVFAFQKKLGSLKFLDPACGSGNFLTETFISLRKLENEALYFMRKGQADLFIFDEAQSPIQVTIDQFYGIEINDFAVAVAKTALWIAESQMMKETSDIINQDLDFLPLTTNAYIAEGNALRMDWNDIIPASDLNYIMGNPPFIGQSLRAKEQAEDMNAVFGKGSIETKLDYVICWYKMSLNYMKDTDIKTAFVSTNSICQGESVPTFWRGMLDNQAEIQFAYKTFIWNSEANNKAHVHCVIVGFTHGKTKNEKLIFADSRVIRTTHINCYLLDAPDIWIENRKNIPPKNMSKMTTGSPPTDDGGLTMSIQERKELLAKYPVLEKYIKPFIGAKEFLHDTIGEHSRYCLWFVDGNPKEYANISEIKERLQRVRNIRLKSNADRINKMADYPYLFCQNRQPKDTYLVFPRHSSENREYIPIGFMEKDVIAGDACSIIHDTPIEVFGILSSNVHNYWMKVVCGRLKSDYRYSPSVYNNFPWLELSNEHKERIKKTARNILDARSLFPDNSLADLYNPLTMPPELIKAHKENDKAVMSAYGFKSSMSEEEIVAELMKLYQKNV